MVIVLSHTVVASILYYRNPQKFLGGGSSNLNKSDAGGESASYEDVTTKLAQVQNFRDLHSVVPDAIESLSSQSVCCIVFLQDVVQEELFADKENKVRFPKHGLCCAAKQTQKTQRREEISPNDPIAALLKQCNKSEPAWKPKNVVCQPVVLTEDKAIIAVIVACNKSGNEVDRKILSFIEKQILACYRRMCKCNGSAVEYTVGDHESSSTGGGSPQSDIKEAIIKLCGELYDQDATILQLKVLKFLEEQTKAEYAFLLLVAPETQELFCQVVGDKVLDVEVRFPGQSSGFAVALETKEPIHLQDIPLDKRKELEEELGIKPLQSFLCVPVTSRNSNNLIALACVVNKKNNEKFTNSDVYSIRQCFQYTATVLTSTLAFQNERKLKIQTQAMLQVARNLFQHLDDLTKLLREIMQEARNLTQAERCSVFLIDTETEELVAKVFDGITTDSSEVQTEIRMPITQGIAGHVATTGELLNIKDAYSHPLFYRGIDDSTGFRTRNILCFPIKDEKGVVMGVSQLCNKKTAQCFTQFDEDVASAFAVYCCISISHSLMYQKVIAAQTRSSLANELMMYHMKVMPEDVQMLIQSDIPPSEFWSSYFDKFNYPPREISDNDTALACFSMFEDLGFISRWRIKKDTLARFVLMVKKGYRSPPYHNWMHAFAVAHFCYLCIKNCNLTQCLEDIELFALFVSCLCHDIDHRGTNNSFQTSSKSVLAALYSSEGSVLERHHFAQTMCIMNTEGCNIFENLTAKHYQKALDLVRDIILATDLAHHFKILGNIQTMAKEGYDKTSDKNHKLLLCLLMTAADLSDQTKPWDKTKHIADLIYREFFSQGDLEKSLGKEPPEMMDRERARIPTLQISFLDNIALPVYRVLNDIFPQAESVRQVVEDNRRHWDKICALIQMKRGGSCEKMSYDQILALEEEELDNTEASPDFQQNGS